MTIDETYRIERVNKENLKHLCYLFKANGNNSYSEEYFQKKFNTAYTGVSYIGYFAFDKETNEPAAFYTVFPYFIKYKNEKILSAQSADTITNPKHQKKGLFIHLANLTYDLAKTEGIKIVFGFPNNESQHGFFKKLNWSKSPRLVTYKINTIALPIYKLLKKTKLLNTIYYPYLNFLQKKFKRSEKIFYFSYENDQCAEVIKDEFYYNYKKYERSYLFKIGEYSVWFKPDYTLRIGNLFSENNQDVNEIISSLKILGFLIGISEIAITITENSFYDKLLKTKYSSSSYQNNPGYILLDKSIGKIDLFHIDADGDTF